VLNTKIVDIEPSRNRKITNLFTGFDSAQPPK